MPALCGHDGPRFMPPPSVAKQRQSVSKGVIGSASWPEPRHLHSHARHRGLTTLCPEPWRRARLVRARRRRFRASDSDDGRTRKEHGKNISKPLARKSCPVFCQSSAIANGKERLRNCRCRCLCSNASACHDGCRNYLALDSEVEGDGIEAAGLRLAWFGVRTVTQEARQYFFVHCLFFS